MAANGLTHLKEGTVHGNVLAPFQRYYCSTDENFTGFSMHWHEELEVMLVRKGKITYSIDFEPVAFREGDLAFISPHVLYAAVPDGAAVTESFVFHLDFLGCRLRDICAVDYLMPLFNGFYKLQPKISPRDSKYPELLACYEALLRCYGAHAFGYELELKERMLRLIRLLFQNGYAVEQPTQSPIYRTEEKIKTALQYISEHSAEPLKIEELAALCGFSESHFMRFFKKYTGVTVITYLNDFRLDYAAGILKTAKSAVTEIALEAGFNNVSYFNRMFKKKFGISPRAYRLQYGQQEVR